MDVIDTVPRAPAPRAPLKADCVCGWTGVAASLRSLDDAVVDHEAYHLWKTEHGEAAEE